MLSAKLFRLAAPTSLSMHAVSPEQLRWLVRHAIEAIDDGIGFGEGAGPLHAAPRHR
jgi:hypothetical protein